ncbi:hypothetical protein Hanom_Chr07g00679781 [Helianthus anomalus]
MWQHMVKVFWKFGREMILISQYTREFTMDAGSGVIRVGLLGFQGTDFHYSDHIKAGLNYWFFPPTDTIKFLCFLSHMSLFFADLDASLLIIDVEDEDEDEDNY